MSADLPAARIDRRSLKNADAALAVLDRLLATPRGAALRAPVVLDAIAIARGVRPSVQHRLYADVWLRELVAEHRSLLATALEREQAALRDALLAEEMS